MPDPPAENAAEPEPHVDDASVPLETDEDAIDELMLEAQDFDEEDE